MTIEEELATAYANLKGHQDRSGEFITQIDKWKSRNQILRSLIYRLVIHPDEIGASDPPIADIGKDDGQAGIKLAHYLEDLEMRWRKN